MKALTLEPIAAIHVLIPASMRKINLALIDIGAGTSDIAITADGTITAYGMVPAAGDEITEAISQKFLLDFHEAEKMKRMLNEKEEITFTDILGVTYQISTKDIIRQIEEDIEQLAKKISHKIIELNGKPPLAVMLIGGGSQTPKMGEKLANLLHLSEQRVAVRGIEAIQYHLKWPKKIKNTPELVTPIGIAITTQENPIQYLTIFINDERIHLFEMKSLTIGDALIAAGISIKSLFGKPGLAMSVTIDHEVKIIPGEHGTLPTILLNKEAANLDALIKNGDQIQVSAGKNGGNASLTVKKALAYSKKKPLLIKIDDIEFTSYPLAEVNGIDVEEDAVIYDRDTINFKHLQTIEEALIFHGYSTQPFTQQKVNYYLQNEKKSYLFQTKKLYQNNIEASLSSFIQSGDTITFSKENIPFPTIGDILAKEIGWNDSIEVTFNGQPITIQNSNMQLYLNKRKASINELIEPNSSIEMVFSDEAHIFSDIFKYVDLNFEKNSMFHLYINGQEAQFDSPIKHGDQLQITWD